MLFIDHSHRETLPHHAKGKYGLKTLVHLARSLKGRRRSPSISPRRTSSRLDVILGDLRNARLGAQQEGTGWGPHDGAHVGRDQYSAYHSHARWTAIADILDRLTVADMLAAGRKSALLHQN
jgi:hypothetical protein